MQKRSLRTTIVNSVLDSRTTFVGISLIPVLLMVVMLAVVVWMSFKTSGTGAAGYSLEAYKQVYGESFTYKALWNTAVFSVVAIVVAFLFGAPIAWLSERTDLRPREPVITVMLLGMLIPGFLSGMGWVFLLNPRIGVINALITSIPGMGWAVIDVGTAPAMGVIQGLSLVSVVFVMVSGTFRAMNPALEEAAEVHGLTFLQTLRKVTLPLAFPGMLAAAIYIVTMAISAFDIPAVIGLSNRVFTFSTLMYFEIQPLENIPRYDVAGAAAILMIVIPLLLLWWYFRVLQKSHRYAVATGRDYRSKKVELGRWRVWAWVFIGGYCLLAQGLPVCMLVWNALIPFPQVPSFAALHQVSLKSFLTLPIDQLLIGVRNTFILAVSVPTLTLLFGLTISWVVVRSRLRGRFIFDTCSFLPHAIPHIIFAVSAAYLALFYLTGILPIYGTIYILMAVYTLVWISFSTRNLTSAMLQIHVEMEEAAAVSGIPLVKIVWKILLPLLWPTMVNIWIWVALLAYRDLTMASILVTTTNLTLPAAIWGIWLGGAFSRAAATVVLLMLIMTPLIFLYLLFVGKRAFAAGGSR